MMMPPFADYAAYFFFSLRRAHADAMRFIAMHYASARYARACARNIAVLDAARSVAATVCFTPPAPRVSFCRHAARATLRRCLMPRAPPDASASCRLPPRMLPRYGACTSMSCAAEALSCYAASRHRIMLLPPAPQQMRDIRRIFLPVFFYAMPLISLMLQRRRCPIASPAACHFR